MIDSSYIVPFMLENPSKNLPKIILINLNQIPNTPTRTKFQNNLLILSSIKKQKLNYPLRPLNIKQDINELLKNKDFSTRIFHTVSNQILNQLYMFVFQHDFIVKLEKFFQRIFFHGFFYAIYEA